MPHSETDLLHIFITRAPHVIPDVRIFRRNVINRVVEIEGRKVTLRSGIEGQCDAYAIVRRGGHVEIETKAAKGRMREAQKRWREWCQLWEIPHLVLRGRIDEEPESTVERWVTELADKVKAC